MNKITKPVPRTMQLDNPSEELTEESKPENQPAEQPQTEEASPAEPSQESHAEQLIEPQFQIPKPPEGQLLSPNERVNAAYKLVYGKNAEIPIRHESIDNERDADWFVCSYLGEEQAKSMGMLAEPEIELGDLLKWLNQTDLVS